MTTPLESAVRVEAGVPAASGSAPTVLRAQGVRRSFAMGDRSLEILHGVDLELRPGELVALVGASGAGKSTLLHLLGLIDRPNEGTIEVGGIDAWKLPVNGRARLRNREIGFVFQFYHLLPELDAVENVLLPAMIAHSTWSYRSRRRDFRRRAVDMLTRFGLSLVRCLGPAASPAGACSFCESRFGRTARALAFEPCQDQIEAVIFFPADDLSFRKGINGPAP